jgi:hypothetical protein
LVRILRKDGEEEGTMGMEEVERGTMGMEAVKLAGILWEDGEEEGTMGMEAVERGAMGMEAATRVGLGEREDEGGRGLEGSRTAYRQSPIRSKVVAT